MAEQLLLWNPFFWLTVVLLVALIRERTNCLKAVDQNRRDYDQALEALRASYEERLKILQEAKNVVWIKADVFDKKNDAH